MDDFPNRLHDKISSLVTDIKQKRSTVSDMISQLEQMERDYRDLMGVQRILIKFFPESFQPHASETLCEFAGKTVLECAEIILRDNGGIMHCKEITRVALERGYRSPRGNRDAVATERSFWDALRRAKDDPSGNIEFVGKRRFRYRAIQ